MPTRKPITMIDIDTALGGGEQGPFPLEPFAVQALAQGDSWFSIGALPPGKTTNLLLELKTARSTVVVQCARPGKVLRLFTDTTREQNFLNQLVGPLARRWSVILISGVGNDIIAAVGSDPSEPPERRLLRTLAERGATATAAADFVSQPGWDRFTEHTRSVFNHLVDLRDQGVNRHVPLVLHNYARMVPRPSGAGLGTGPWLHPAFEAYAVAPALREAVADELLGRMTSLINQLIDERRSQDPDCALHLVDSMGLAGVTPAVAGSSGSSGDWVNEIHLTRSGYRKCAAVWADVLDGLPA